MPPQLQLSFQQSIRVVVDFGDSRCVDISHSRLVFFGKPGRRSFRHDGHTWHIFNDPCQDLSTVTLEDLTPDPLHLRVYYLLFRGENEAGSKKVRTGTDNVIGHIGRCTLDIANTLPTPTPMRDPKKGKKSPQIGEDIISAMSMEQYFHHVYVNLILVGFLNILKSPLPGFDKDGRKEDGLGDEDVRFLGVDQVGNLDDDSVDLFVSLPTVQRK